MQGQERETGTVMMLLYTPMSSVSTELMSKSWNRGSSNFKFWGKKVNFSKENFFFLSGRFDDFFVGICLKKGQQLFR